MSDLNQCNFIGRLGDNPQMRTTQSGDTMATFSIAVSEKWNDKQGNRQEKTEWVNIQAFGKLAEIMGQYLTKGSQVFISGKFQSRKFTGQDGVERTAVSILANQMQMLGGGQNSQQQGNQGYPQQGQNTAHRATDGAINRPKTALQAIFPMSSNSPITKQDNPLPFHHRGKTWESGNATERGG